MMKIKIAGNTAEERLESAIRWLEDYVERNKKQYYGYYRVDRSRYNRKPNTLMYLELLKEIKNGKND